MHLGILTDPALSGSVSVFTADTQINIHSWQEKKTQDTTGGVPTAVVEYGYAKNYTVNSNPLGGVSDKWRAWLAAEWRKDIEYSPLNYHTASGTTPIDTAFVTYPPHVVGLLTVPRTLVDVVLTPDAFLAGLVLLPGQCVTLNMHGRFGQSARKTIIVGILTNYVTETVTLTLWS